MNIRNKTSSLPEEQKSSQGFSSLPNEAILNVQLLLTLLAVKPSGKNNVSIKSVMFVKINLIQTRFIMFQSSDMATG